MRESKHKKRQVCFVRVRCRISTHAWACGVVVWIIFMECRYGQIGACVCVAPWSFFVPPHFAAPPALNVHGLQADEGATALELPLALFCIFVWVGVMRRACPIREQDKFPLCVCMCSQRHGRIKNVEDRCEKALDPISTLRKLESSVCGSKRERGRE
jgi:hypothetical protein